MKLIYVTEAFPYGKGEIFIIPELRNMVSSHRVDVSFIPLVKKTQLINKDASEFLPCTISTEWFAWRFLLEMFYNSFQHPIRTLTVISWLFKARSVKVLLRNMYSYPKGFWLARIVKRIKADHIHANFAVSSSTIAMVASKLSGIPWSFTAHRYDIVENDLLELKITNARFARFISESGIALACKLAIDTSKGNVLLLHMGVEIPEVSNNSIGFTTRCVPTILCPANLLPVKGHSYLLEAVVVVKKAGRQVRLLIAGDGELRHELEAKAKQLNIFSEISFLGHVSHDELMQMYIDRRVDIVVLPSIDLGNGLHEGIPVALIEAMSYELPVIATDTGGISELLKDGAGLLVPQKDPQSLAGAILKLSNDATLMRELGMRGRKRVEEEFSVRKTGDTLVGLFAR